MKTAIFAFLFSLSAFSGQFNTVNNFGDNPGGISMNTYIPDNMEADAPLLVLLHGCQQQARSFFEQTGWQDMAEKLGMAVLMPEQSTSNNGMRCFTWFEERDTFNAQGEVGSIGNMIAYMEKNYSIDDKIIFAAGLSAGATMAAALLANFPEKMAGAGIVSGVSFGCALGLGSSFSCMLFPSKRDANSMGDLVRRASGSFNGTYPKVTIIHGDGDFVVKTDNAFHSTEQWLNVHGADNTVDANRDVGANHQLDQYKADGSIVVERVIIKNSGHGWPVDPANGCGSSGQFILNKGICGVEVLAKSWNLIK